MTLLESSLLIGAIAFVIIGAYAIDQVLHERRRRHSLSTLTATLCRDCQCTFGEPILSTATTTWFMWDPLPGNTLKGLDLPNEVWTIVCPHCTSVHHFRLDGRLFDGPSKGSVGVEISRQE